MTHPLPTLDDLAVDFEDEGSGGPTAKTGSPERRPFPAREMARRMLWKACRPVLRRDIRRRRCVVVVIEPPSHDWFDLIQDAASDLFCSADYIFCEEGKKGKSHALQEAALRSSISTGRSLVAVCSAGRSELAPAILDAADYHIAVEHPDRSVLAATVRAVFGSVAAAKIPRDVGRESTSSALITAIRRTESSGKAITRLIALDQRNRSRAPLSLPDGPSLAELEGYGAAKRWGLELADDLQAYRRGEVEWSALASTAILHGQPGTGKTFFAAALARSCRVPMVATSLGQLFGQSPGYLDSIVKGLDQVFREARTKAPSLLFIDELDAFPDRNTLEGRGRDWWTTVITHFLKLLDDGRHGVIVLAATNMLHRIDAAILRAGRIERHFEIAPPGEHELAGIFRHHLGKHLPDADLTSVARLANGSTGAQVALCVKSAIAEARRGQRHLQIDDIIRQIVSDDYAADELRTVCVHEAGHAIAALALGRRVQQLTTVKKGAIGGGALIAGGGRIATRERLEDDVIIALGGRASEILLQGHASSGAEKDLEAATGFICEIHGSLGFGQTIAQRAPSSRAMTLMTDPTFRDLVESELRKLDARCMALLTARLHELQQLAEALQSKRALSGEEITTLVGMEK